MGRTGRASLATPRPLDWSVAIWPGPPSLSWMRITIRDTLMSMSSAISVRLDDDSERALRILNACGMSTSDAIRSSLISSAQQVRGRAELKKEVAAIEADAADRDEMLAIADLMESMRAAR